MTFLGINWPFDTRTKCIQLLDNIHIFFSQTILLYNFKMQYIVFSSLLNLHLKLLKFTVDNFRIKKKKNYPVLSKLLDTTTIITTTTTPLLIQWTSLHLWSYYTFVWLKRSPDFGVHFVICLLSKCLLEKKSIKTWTADTIFVLVYFCVYL